LNSRIEEWGELIIPPGSKSNIWAHFHVYSKNPTMANCNYCAMDIKKSGGTSHMAGHYNCCQSKKIAAEKTEGFVKLFDISKSSSVVGPMDKFLKPAIDFPTLATKWIVLSKKSFEIVEDPLFREMCYSLNPKAEVLTVRRVKDIDLLYITIQEVDHFLDCLEGLLETPVGCVRPLFEVLLCGDLS
jgi:hypothetical protein